MGFLLKDLGGLPGAHEAAREHAVDLGCDVAEAAAWCIRGPYRYSTIGRAATPGTSATPTTRRRGPGAWLYAHSKYLGQEVVRLFAEQYGLSVPALYFCNFVNPEVAVPGSYTVSPSAVSWNDAGHAMRRALEVPELPSPCEILHILADLPHGKYSGEKAYRLLRWRP